MSPGPAMPPADVHSEVTERYYALQWTYQGLRESSEEVRRESERARKESRRLRAQVKLCYVGQFERSVDG